MSRHKNRRTRTSRESAPMEEAFVGSPQQYFAGYDGARASGNRGYVPWPMVTGRDELDSYTRAELIRRIHWLKANSGLVRGIIKNSADFVGWQTCQANSGDKKWDAIAEDRAREILENEETFDLAGKFDFHDAQSMLLRCAFTDGDVLTVMSRKADGSAWFAFYQACQLANPEGAGKEWKEGIKIVKRRHVAYGLRDAETDKVVVIPASSCIYFGDFDHPGQDRPEPPLCHAVTDALDIAETRGFVKKAIKVSSLFGAVREQDVTGVPRSRQGISGSPRTVASETPDGVRSRFEVADVWSGGQIPRLEPGEKIKTLQDDKRNPNAKDFESDLIRSIFQGFGLSPEVGWHMANLTGPGIRYVLENAERWIRRKQKLLRKWSRKAWRFTIACEIDSKRLPVPAGEAKWWKLTFTSERSMTIDRGAMSRAAIAELEAGVRTLSDFEEFDGRDWMDRADQRMDEVAYLKEGCEERGLDYHTVFPPRQGAAAPPEASADPEEEPAKPGKKNAANDTTDEEE